MTSVSKAFCSFCKALGKPEAVYTSHYVKDKIGGAVVCPALLANECGYCHDHGHTPKFCPKLAARDARRAQRAKAPKRAGWQTARRGSKARSADGARPTPIRTNPFEALATQKPVAGRPTTPVGPRPVAVKSPQGVWNADHKAEVAGLKAELEALKQQLAKQATVKAPEAPKEPVDPFRAGLLLATAAEAATTAFAPIPLPDDGDFLADLGKKAPSGDGWGSDDDE